MRDIVIGSIINYGWDNIKYWVNSLDRSGFSGEKMMLCFNIDQDTIEQLKKRKYTIISLNSYNMDISNFNIVVDRFYYIWQFLLQCKNKYRYVIATDVKDVIFQNNPSEYVEKSFENSIRNKTLIMSTESILYKDEEWGANNILKSFGVAFYEQLKNNIIINCGVLSGKYSSIIDLFLSIYMISNGASGRHISGGGGPDQASLNILLNMKNWKDTTIINKSEDGWAAQLGTTGPQILTSVREKLVEKTPILLNNQICTSTGKTFTIVHQYDRTPWKTIIENTYKD